MDEYEKLEAELKKVYEDYVSKFRCLAFLEQQVEEFERVEQEKMEERKVQTKKILERMENDDKMRSFGGKVFQTSQLFPIAFFANQRNVFPNSRVE